MFAAMDLCKILISLTATLATGTLAQDEPQRRLNETLILKEFPNALSAGDSSDPLFRRASDSLSCQAGYSLCEGEAVCCPTGNTCCSNGYCTDPGYTCCTTLLGSCPNGWQCCADGGCAPLLGECCAGGLYCPAGKQCRTWKGEQTCCPSSGCSGENDTGGSESTLLVATPTISATSVSTSPSGRSLDSQHFKHHSVKLWLTSLHYISHDYDHACVEIWRKFTKSLGDIRWSYCGYNRGICRRRAHYSGFVVQKETSGMLPTKETSLRLRARILARVCGAL
ncbi:hypothetical protein N7509_007674 [Penicillium cosmopolitanum]|uniref:Granulins domain-containing protein n=1 Tax=Penicillium cosmopolitanum TaxID=1131564 RepID=A0A9W9VZB2_9EURO|nr:uncharacterized protein N7509_007674 [Penicillium cosmopolitanum]KAJ5392184.1 hypothetical protein N7509_007674 [Penicillium cosmopolitanum]